CHIFSFLHCHRLPPHIPSFPTRRSSDLSSVAVGRHTGKNQHKLPESLSVCDIVWACRLPARVLGRFLDRCLTASSTACAPAISRSEEHTSELQSRFDIVCRLLLEKKKID